MSLIKKSDVSNHLSRRGHKAIHLYQPASQPEATGFSSEEAEQAAKESHMQPNPGKPGTPPQTVGSGLRPVLVPAASQSAQV